MDGRSRKSIVMVIPSSVVARGLEAVLSVTGEFRVDAVTESLPSGSDAAFGNADIVVVDPSVAGFSSLDGVVSSLRERSGAAVVAIQVQNFGEDALKQFDEVINLYDAPSAVVRKLRSVTASSVDAVHNDGEELTGREKEILVCVAKGMLNKEIADLFCLSIHTVITHRKNITRKTGIKTVAGLTVYALLNNLIDYSSIE